MFSMFRVDAVDPVLHVMVPLTRLAADRVHMKLNPNMFSLTVSNNSPPLNVTLRFSPRFFNAFRCHYTHHGAISLRRFFFTLIEGIRHFAWKFTIRYRVLLAFFDFQHRYAPLMLHREMPLSYSREERMDEINYSTFVSIPSPRFGHIVAELDDSLVRVSLKDSQVMFFTDTQAIVLIKEGGQCSIEGVNVGDEIEFLITLHPMAFFLDLTIRSISISLYKTRNNQSTMIVTLGPYVKYVIYFPGEN